MLENFKTVEQITANDGRNFENELKKLKPQINLANNPYYYPFISFHVQSIVNEITIAKKLFKEINGREAKTFLDIGCGIGNVLYIANLFNLRPFGVELIREYLEVAMDLVPNSMLYQGDILEWKPEYESDYDIIYFFQPIANHERMSNFLDHLLSYVSKGQIIIANFADEFPNFNGRVDFHTEDIVVVN